MNNYLQEKYFDIGANLTHPSFTTDLDNIIDTAKKNGVKRISITGSDLLESEKALVIANQYSDSIISTAGIHPHQAKNYTSSYFSEIKELLAQEQVRSIGETGLDFYRNFSTPLEQEKSFEAHLEIAIDIQMPLFLHEREAHKRFLEILKPLSKKLPKTIVHCFTGSKEELLEYIDLDFYIGITGWICDERRGKHLEELVNLIPLSRLMIESDAPYLLPRDMGIKNSSKNEPKFLPHIAKKIAECRSEEFELLISSIYMNSIGFFNLKN